MDHILSIVLFTPLVGALILFLIPDANSNAVRWWANIASFLGFVVSLPLVFQFDRTKDFQFVEKASFNVDGPRAAAYGASVKLAAVPPNGPVYRLLEMTSVSEYGAP